MYSPLVGLKQGYLKLLKEKNRSAKEQAVFCCLVVLSAPYAAAVAIRNFLYDRGFLGRYWSKKKVVSIGNLSWGGTGKTSMVLYLHNKLKPLARTCIITKGYARDEYSLIRRNTKSVYDARNRIRLVRRLEREYDVFLLDDGFQYRSLVRDVNIVLINKHELTRGARLIPAGPFREPFSSLRRADIIVVSYCASQELVSLRRRISRINKNAHVFAADYKVAGVLDHNLKRVPHQYLSGKRIGALTAIGYPEGFLQKIEEAGFHPEKTLIYPDHYEFRGQQLRRIEREFSRRKIEDVLITYKDYYHIDFTDKQINYFILQVELCIDQPQEFFTVIAEQLGLKI